MKMGLVAVAVSVAIAVAGSVSAQAADKYLQRVDSNGNVVAPAKATKTKKASSKAKKVAKAKSKSISKAKNPPSAKKMSRDVVFDGSTVNGRYHSAGEAVATVENEKKLNDLIGARKDFKDRLAVENARLKKDGVR
jgi:hypothetical protein